MIEVDEALRLIEAAAVPLPPRRQRLLDACGFALAEPVVSDVDSPPWDRAMMDGFAVRGGDVAAAAGGVVELDVVVDLAAGDVTTIVVGSGGCARIMTGAPLPAGADAVIPVECALDGTAATHAGGRVRLRDERFRPGQHVARRGTAFQAGAEVLASGTVLGAAEIGLAAEAGATHVVAACRPRVAILSTGSELVPPAATPAFGQTRNSNGPMLAAAVRLLGAEPIPLGLVADRPEALRAAVAQGLAADVLLLSGGVSAGDLDLVPGVLALCGVEQVFHKVRHKPGKPLWFGVYRRAAAPGTLVFGLPGNPASSLVCFDLFARPALGILGGKPRDAWHLPRARARLTAPAKAAADRPVYLPCRLAGPPDALEATPLPWTGSSDLRGFAGANGYVALPANGKVHEAGTEVDVVLRP
ncbi:MAG: molybdopterin molybdenumtransferase MoeA [Planctomycetia bacterium]|nr:molybdopterin molybdenumtransferase MoeA [Planctomycetia bacterium]